MEDAVARESWAANASFGRKLQPHHTLHFCSVFGHVINVSFTDVIMVGVKVRTTHFCHSQTTCELHWGSSARSPGCVVLCARVTFHSDPTVAAEITRVITPVIEKIVSYYTTSFSESSVIPPLIW